MKTVELLELLNQNSDKALLFEYLPGQFIQANYHITEIKNTIIDAVDCGGNSDFWKETIVQIYENPDEPNKAEFMTVQKAMDIFNRVDAIKPMVRDAEIKFEYSNTNFHTAQLFVDDIANNEDQLVIKLAVEKTDCKAKDTCVAPVESEMSVQGTCTPDSGCC